MLLVNVLGTFRFFLQFREIKIRYAYNGQSNMRNLCDQKSVGFLVHVQKIELPLEDFIATV